MENVDPAPSTATQPPTLVSLPPIPGIPADKVIEVFSFSCFYFYFVELGIWVFCLFFLFSQLLPRAP
jgi:hypothetical protein